MGKAIQDVNCHHTITRSKLELSATLAQTRSTKLAAKPQCPLRSPVEVKFSRSF